MTIVGISQNFYSTPSHTSSNAAKQPTNAVSQPKSQDDDALLQELKDYFFKSPAERLVENWLRAHGITKEQFDAMPKEQQVAIRREMAEEIKDRCEKKAEERSKIGLDRLA